MSLPRRPLDRKIVIAGAGCAGLALAYWLVRLGEAEWDIDIVDASLGDPPRKMWSFWGEVPEPAEGSVERTWHKMAMSFPGWTRVEPLGHQPYHSIRSERYVATLIEALSKHPKIRFIEDRVREIHDLGERRSAVVVTERGELPARFVFQSCFPLGASGKARYPLRQHFGGWEIETELPQPDSDVVTLMDFSTTAPGEVSFSYVLPLSPYRRLVEHTVFSPQPEPRGVYDEAVRAYLERHVIGSFRCVQKEYGVIPMEERVLGQRHGQNVWNLGAMGGMTKPTTGYTFVRSQRQARHLAETLLFAGEPRPLPPPPRRFRFYDTVLLQLLYRRPEVGVSVFESLFAHHRYSDVLRFLDEGTRLGEEVRFFRHMPLLPFLGALTRVAPALPALADAR